MRALRIQILVKTFFSGGTAKDGTVIKRSYAAAEADALAVGASGASSSIYPFTTKSDYTSFNRGSALASIVSPAQIMMVFELNEFGEPTVKPAWNLTHGTWDGGSARIFGHLGTSNFLFCDGHVKALKPMATVTPVNMWDIRNNPPSGNLASSLASSEAAMN